MTYITITAHTAVGKPEAERRIRPVQKCNRPAPSGEFNAAYYTMKRKSTGTPPPVAKAKAKAAPIAPSTPAKTIALKELLPGPRLGYLLSHAAVPLPRDDADTLKHNVHATASYLDAMITLIPAEYYVPKTDDEIELTWSKYHVVRCHSSWRGGLPEGWGG